MKKVLLVLIMLILSNSLWAQTNVQINDLKTFSEEYKKTSIELRSEAEKLAKQLNIPIKKTLEDGTVIELQYFENDLPVYYITNNLTAAATISTDQCWPGGSLGLNLTGSGITLGEWDGGAVRLTHQEFGGRVAQEDGDSSISDHSTHVAGTMVAAGVYAQAKGMCYQGEVSAYDWNSDISEMAAAAAAGLKVSNHSYGSITGWRYNFFGGGIWVWFGDTTISRTEAYRFGFYNSEAYNYDQLSYLAPNYLICKSAGNDRGEGPAGEVEHYVYPDNENLVTAERDDDGGALGYDCINGGGIAKNVLTVAAVNDVPGGYTNSGDVVMSSFSSWGPCDDGRIKPDISANGVGLISPGGSADNAYLNYSGTSMASPNAAGSIGIILNHQAVNCGGGDLWSSTIKGMILHTADEAGSDPGPDYKFGWGLMNAKSVVELMTENYTHVTNTSAFNIRELRLDNEETEEIKVYTDGSGPVKVTICWTDKAGTPPAASLNPRTAMLVNDLDLRLNLNSSTYYPWKLDPDNPTNAATNNGDNAIDNVEQVYIANPSAGIITINVNHKGTFSSPAYQDFSIIMTGVNELIPPTLVSPEDQEIPLALSATLSWQTVPKATTYRVQFSTEYDFSSNVTEYTTGSLSQNITLPDYNTEYYWRVRAENVLENGPWSVVRAFTTLLETPVLQAPVNLSVGCRINGDVEWNNVNGAESYEVQISLNSDFTTIVANPTDVSTLTYSYSGLNNYATYYWRVKAKNSAGNEGAFSAHWEFKTIFAAPVLASPANNSTGKEIAGSLNWNAVAEATTYNLQLSDMSDFSNLIIDQAGIAALTYPYSGLDNDKKYYWRVSGTGADGTSEWSEVWNYKTILDAPVLALPADNAKEQPVNGLLDWGDVSGAESYMLQVSELIDFSVLAIDQSGLMASEYNYANLDNDKTYYWRAKAVNADSESPWSSEWSFKTILATPALATPLNNSEGLSTTGTMTWSSVSGATSYDLQISTSSNFNVNQVDLTGIGTTSYNFNLDDSKTYYWRVRASNADGKSPWTGAWRFKTTLLPPTLNFPANASTGLTLTLNLRWNAVGGATKYNVQVSTNASFTDLILNDANVASTAYYSSGAVLSHYKTYYWRVRAMNANGAGLWSDIWTFSTFISNPTLNAPASKSIDQPLSGVLEWYNVPGAYSYDLQISEYENFSMITKEEYGLNSLSYNYDGLTYMKTYWWRVRAKNEDGTTIWSDKWRFRTELPVPVLSAPANNADDQPLSGTFRWEPVSGAMAYVIWAYEHDGESKRQVISATVEGGNTFFYAGLKQNALHSWKVQAIFSDELRSEYSESWKFTTRMTLQAPELLSPADESDNIKVSGTLSWKEEQKADTYGLQVSESADFSSYAISENLSATQYDYNDLDYGKQYFWRVNATGQDGTSDWSEIWSFNTSYQIPIPDLVNSTTKSDEASPIDGKLVWFATDGALTYNVQMSEDAAFSSSFIDESGLTDAFYDYISLNNYTEYYWRASAVYKDNQDKEVTSDWSEPVKFTTIMAQPVLSLPANDAKNLDPLGGELSWIGTNGAKTYNLQLSEDENFGTLIIDEQGVSGLTYSYPALSDMTKYYWKINAVNSLGESPWSEVWNFTTGIHTAVIETTEQEFGLTAYPNPFNNTTMIEFTLEESAKVRISVHNLYGEQIAELGDKLYGKGCHSVKWEPYRSTPSGAYFVRLLIGENTIAYRVIYNK